MSERPNLDQKLNGETFRSYYYLKEELVEFCRTNQLPTSGGKIELTERISHFLDTGKVLAAPSKKAPQQSVSLISEMMAIEPDFVCTETHRAFFKEKIGENFTFPVSFQKWLKANAVRLIKKQLLPIIKY